jgi:uncharacterized protein YdhG (YjbR/CyaY superfamily)
MNAEVKSFMDGVPLDRRPLFDQLHALIMNLYPNAETVLSYGVPTYKTKTGWVSLGYWKNGVTIYTNGPHNIAEFKANYPAIKTGTGCINFRVTDVIPVEALKKVIVHVMEHSIKPK